MALVSGDRYVGRCSTTAPGEVEVEHARSGGVIVAEALRRAGVDTLFTLCGGHVSSLLDGCVDAGIRVIDTRHEGAAVLAAEGHALATGRTGVAAVTAGPGFANAFIGLADAGVWTVPLVLFGGRTPAGLVGQGSVADLDQRRVADSVVKHSVVGTDAARLGNAVAEAMHVARAGRPGPVYLEVPKDVLGARVEPDESGGFPLPARPAPDAAALTQTLDALERAARPVVVAGGGAFWSGAGPALARFAEVSGVPVTTTGAARGLIPDSHPCCLGSMMHAGGAVAAADLVVVLGSAFNANLLYGRPPLFPSDAVVVQVDVDPERLGGQRRPDIAVVADVAITLTELADAWRKGSDRSDWMAQARDVTAFVRSTWDRQIDDHSGSRLHAGAAAREVVRFARDALGDAVTFVADGGDALAWAMAYAYAEGPGRVLTTTTALGTLGVGLPFSVAAAAARPGEPVLLFCGDGAFGFHAMEIDTAVRHGLPVICVVSNNLGWRDVSKGQDDRYGRRVASDLADTRYDQLGIALGAHGELVERLDQLRPALGRCLDSGGPAVVNVRTDAEVVSELMMHMGELQFM